MRALLLLVVLLGVSPVWAARTNVVFQNWTGAGVKGASATAANGAFSTPATINMAGKQITVQANSTFAANAASFAVSAVRLNPAGLVFGAVASWLLSEGINYANNAFTKTQAGGAIAPTGRCQIDGPTSYYTGVFEGYTIAQCKAAADARAASNNTSGDFGAWQSTASSGFGWQRIHTNPAYHLSAGLTNTICPGGAVATSVTSCGSSPDTQVPATESDFNTVASHPLPDSAAQQLAQGGIEIPTAPPVVAPQDFPLGAPRLDPVNNRMVQDKARITQPLPTESPTALDVQAWTEDAGAVTGQTADPVAPKTAQNDLEPGRDEQQKTDCDKFPNALGCLDASDTVTDDTLQTQSPSFAIAPITLGTAGACPANPIITTSVGSYELKLQPICDATAWLKPLVLALAWFVAAGIVSGAIRGD